jgi:hypothetical protein
LLFKRKKEQLAALGKIFSAILVWDAAMYQTFLPKDTPLMLF